MRQPHKIVKHLNNLLAVNDELFERVWPFCGAGIKRVKNLVKYQNV